MLNPTRILKHFPVLGPAYLKNYAVLKHTYHNLLRNSGLRPGPLMVSWVATNRCDSKCVYCEARANEADPKELTTDEIKKVIDDLAGLNVQRFFVIGGEPLMRRDLFDVLAHARQQEMTVGIFTNSLQYKKYQQQIQDAGLQNIWTSIDGLETTHDKYRGRSGAYATTMAAMEYFARIDIPVRVINTVVHPGNMHEMSALFERVMASGATWWRLGTVAPVGRAMEKDEFCLSAEATKALLRFAEACRREFNVTITEEMGYIGCYEDTLRDGPFYCHAGQTFCAIMPDGNVVPCQTDDGHQFSEGNIRERSFRDIWQHGFTALRNVTLPAQCESCENRRACYGGCWIVRRHGAPCIKRTVGL